MNIKQCNVIKLTCVVIYFLFVICLCVFAVLITIVVLHLYLRADSHPLVAMPAWVSRLCKYVFDTRVDPSVGLFFPKFGWLRKKSGYYPT